MFINKTVLENRPAFLFKLNFVFLQIKTTHICIRQ